MTASVLRAAGQAVRLAGEAGVTFGTAESCTGGLLGGAITAIPGASAVYYGGVVSYANEIKTRLLGVPAALLENRGAVSAEVAKAMAEGAKEALGVDFALAVTGLAGPGGATEGHIAPDGLPVPPKPVGLVYLALACPRGAVLVEEHRFTGDREAVREQTVLAALALFCRAVAPEEAL